MTSPLRTALSHVDDLLRTQHGVITRGQAMAGGFSAADIRRMVRRREWATVYPGVYVNHTGPLTWRQRAWAAVLDAYPAALSHSSALIPGSAPAHGSAPATLDERSAGVIHIVVDRSRRITRRPGVVVHYASRLDDRVLWHTDPPRVRVEEAVLDLADAASSELDVVGHLTEAVNARTTTATRLIEATRRRPRMRRRELIVNVLHDVRDGTCSVLEHAYLRRIERAHGLPSPRRQAPTTVGRRGFRDVDYPEWGVVVELDGRAGHDGPRERDRDLQRDLDAAVGAARQTLRLGWGQVFGRACATAHQVGQVLRSHGWTGSPSRCPSCPPVP
ncbi:type IV toxin-antitoxin system AbiEi family antitoxin domain-containing protein [Gordonia sp. NPDC003425]